MARTSSNLIGGLVGGVAAVSTNKGGAGGRKVSSAQLYAFWVCFFDLVFATVMVCSI